MLIDFKSYEELVDKVAEALRAIGQPDTKDLVFVCENGSDFADYASSTGTILGIPVYVIPVLDIRGGLLLAGKGSKWVSDGTPLLKFQREMEI